MMRNRILVMGSSNVDLILRVPRFPNPGETITGENLVTAFGGKGANQAIAARRLGGDVIFLTKLGRDSFGEAYRKYLAENDLPPHFLLQDKKLPSGVAIIELTPKGENRIIVSPGANGSLSVKDLQDHPGIWKGVGIFVAQLETPLDTVKKGLMLARKNGSLTLLNPAPSIPLSSEVLSLVDFLVPNEWEAQLLTGIRMKGEKDLPQIAQRLLGKGIGNVAITLGARGLYFQNQVEEIWMNAFRVKAVDTTAAGDAFVGALACGLAGGKSIREALKQANAAGALATTKLGAQPSLPQGREVDKFLRKLKVER
jgi:ribokinase